MAKIDAIKLRPLDKIEGLSPEQQEVFNKNQFDVENKINEIINKLIPLLP